jgi:hypothetical protein
VILSLIALSLIAPLIQATQELSGEQAIQQGKAFLLTTKIGPSAKLTGLQRETIERLQGQRTWNLGFRVGDRECSIRMLCSDGKIVSYWTRNADGVSLASGLDCSILTDTWLIYHSLEVIKQVGYDVSALGSARVAGLGSSKASKLAVWFDLLIDGHRAFDRLTPYGYGLLWNQSDGQLLGIETCFTTPKVGHTTYTLTAEAAMQRLRDHFNQQTFAIQTKGPKSKLVQLDRKEAIYWSDGKGSLEPAWLFRAELKQPPSRRSPGTGYQWVVVDAVTGTVVHPFTLTPNDDLGGVAF